MCSGRWGDRRFEMRTLWDVQISEIDPNEDVYTVNHNEGDVGTLRQPSTLSQIPDPPQKYVTAYMWLSTNPTHLQPPVGVFTQVKVSFVYRADCCVNVLNVTSHITGPHPLSLCVTNLLLPSPWSMSYFVDSPLLGGHFLAPNCVLVLKLAIWVW